MSKLLRKLLVSQEHKTEELSSSAFIASSLIKLGKCLADQRYNHKKLSDSLPFISFNTSTIQLEYNILPSKISENTGNFEFLFHGYKEQVNKLDNPNIKTEPLTRETLPMSMQIAFSGKSEEEIQNEINIMKNGDLSVDDNILKQELIDTYNSSLKNPPSFKIVNFSYHTLCYFWVTI